MTTGHLDAAPWARAWQTFWFAAAGPETLAWCRILFFAGVAAVWIPRDPSAWASVSDLFWEPVWGFRVLHLPRLEPATVHVLHWAWIGVLLASCVGLWTRASSVTAFALGFYLIGLPHNVGKIHHSDAVVVLTLAIMALARSGDAWSLDRWRRRRRSSPSPPPGPSDGEYTWPIQLVRVVLACAFFAAGVAKLRTSGLAWLAPESFATLLTVNHYHQPSSDPLTSLGLVVAQWPVLCFLGALGTMAVELLYPVALVSRHARAIVVPAAVGLLVTIRLVMGPSFAEFVLCHLFWVPWGRLRRRSSRHRLTGSAASPRSRSGEEASGRTAAERS